MALSLAIILVEPQLGENMGAVARVMANFGLSQLIVVNPRDGWPNEAAISMAAHAVNILEQAKVVDRIEDAVADCHYVTATTNRRRGMDKPVFTPRSFFQRPEMMGAAADGERDGSAATQLGILFGPERCGLSNDHIALSDSVISIPTDEGYSSLNLAQAVAVMAYEHRLFCLSLAEESEETKGDESFSASSTHSLAKRATKAEIQHLVTHLHSALAERDYFKSAELEVHMRQNMVRAVTDCSLSSQEVQTLRGIIRTLTEWPVMGRSDSKAISKKKG